jgi:GTPase SAR1 family protein
VLYYRDLDHTITFKGVEINADPTNIRNGITRPLKFVILGQTGVGKSSIVLQYVKGKFNEYHDMTIGGMYILSYCWNIYRYILLSNFRGNLGVGGGMSKNKTFLR